MDTIWDNGFLALAMLAAIVAVGAWIYQRRRAMIAAVIVTALFAGAWAWSTDSITSDPSEDPGDAGPTVPAVLGPPSTP